MKKLNFCIFLALLFIVSCSEDSTLKSAVQLFTGTWSWTYTVNCGAGIDNETGDVVITESTLHKGELFVILPGLGGFEASASGEPNPFFYFDVTDANGVNVNADGYLEDGVLSISGAHSDNSPLFYCAFVGDAVKP